MYECCSCEAYINKWSKPYWFNLLDVFLPMQRRFKELSSAVLARELQFWNHLSVQLLFPWRTKFLPNRIICLQLDGWKLVWPTEKSESWLSRKMCVHKVIIGCSWCSVYVGVLYYGFLPWSWLTWMCTVSIEGNVWNDLSTGRTIISAKCLVHLWARD